MKTDRFLKATLTRKNTQRKGDSQMAIMHINFKILKRSEGKSSIYLAAYNNRERLKDERTGAIWNYTKKQDLYHSEIMLPDNAPDRFRDRVTLYNEIEKTERRADSQIVRYFIVALPRDLSPDENKKLLKKYLKKNFVDKGMIADFAIHDINSNNPHAHVMLTLRDVCSSGFLNKNREWNKKENVDIWRKKWAYEVNVALKNNNVMTRISPLSDLKRKEEIIKQAEKYLNEGEELKAEHALMIAQKLVNKKTKKRIPRKKYMYLKNQKHTKETKKETKKQKEENKKVSKLKSIFNSLMSKFNQLKNEKEIKQLNDKLKTLQEQKHAEENKFFNDTLKQLKDEKAAREEKEKLEHEAAERKKIENKKIDDINKLKQSKKGEVKNERRRKKQNYVPDRS